LLRGLDPHVQFQLANAIWYRQSMASAFETQFLSDTRSYFDAEVGPLDMASPQAVNTVNDWAKRSTGGRIEKVLDAIDDDIVMLLANAIYFKGDWREQFDGSKTKPEPFSAPGGIHDVPTMQREGTVRYARIPQAEVVDLPYGGGAYSMTILLPEQGADIDAFVSQLTQASWQGATTNLQKSDAEIHLPSFTMKWEETLNVPLKSLGMRQAFRPGEADFTRMSMSSGHDLFISFVRQSTFVDVNEEGTEAAAVTIVGVGVTSMPEKLIVRINRPFVFAIRENLSGTILFLGKIVDPAAS
jgi:serpin B